MVTYSVYSSKAESDNFEYTKTHHTLSSAKKEIKRLWKEGFDDAEGSMTKIYSNGDWEPCGKIAMTGCNKIFIANSKMKGSNYID